MFGALPSRIARAQHRQREPVDLQEEDPRDVGLPAPPCRFATRCVTRTVYASSSLVPKTTSSAVDTTAAMSAVASAQPKLSIWMAPR